MALGIENLKKTLRTINNFTIQIAQTKKFRLTSLFAFIDDLFALGAVITDWKNIVAEYKDLDEPEKAEIVQFVKDEFDIPNNEVEAFVEDAFQWLLATISLVERARRLKK